MKFIDSTVRDIYSIAADLVNDGMEVTRGYEKLVSALDVWQQQILRKCGPFVRPTTSKASKPQGGKPTNAVSSATGMDKKKRSKGSDRKSLGLPPHTAPPSFKNQPSATSKPAPATPLVRFSIMDTRKIPAGGTKAAQKV